MTFGQRDFCELIINRPGELGLQPVPDEQPGRGAVFAGRQRQRMIGPQDNRITTVETECDCPLGSSPFALQSDRTECGAVDVDVQLLDRCHQDMAAVGLAAEDG